MYQGKEDFLYRWEHPVQNTASSDQFEPLKKLGTGSFRWVVLVRHQENCGHNTIKILNKQDNCRLYLVMEYLPGADMFSHLRRVGRFREPHACFYAAQIVLAFQYLHSLDLIHRDLKPKNLLIDQQGYLQVMDFSFAKRVRGCTWTLCVTSEYLTPRDHPAQRLQQSRGLLGPGGAHLRDGRGFPALLR
ncbi:hypothetical protein P7K49_027971 [Saguinus oedipus]|uniref:Protein kinase domain-containing protein n=1 Tax=Saguinus oedipus TaxID=9490 RepID=A0ABQ9UAZ1_SAGOE|nr:hypothetical protein P7K49_027971 [Saguinus oedipus]